jgi:hypothetical protein
VEATVSDNSFSRYGIKYDRKNFYSAGLRSNNGRKVLASAFKKNKEKQLRKNRSNMTSFNDRLRKSNFCEIFNEKKFAKWTAIIIIRQCRHLHSFFKIIYDIITLLQWAAKMITVN